MKGRSRQHQFFKATLLVVAVALVFGAGKAQAQHVFKWLSVGDFQHMYNDIYNVPENDTEGLQYPGIRPYTDNYRSKSLWVAATNFTSPSGENFPVKIAHVGPRVPGTASWFPQKFKMVSKFEPPQVYVDGLRTFDKPVVNDEVDPSMEADRMIHVVANNQLGLRMERTISQFSQDYHEDYHVIEMTFTNTGNTDDDAEIELTDQTLEGLYFFIMNRNAVNKQAANIIGGGAGWGKNVMNDAVWSRRGDLEDYEQDFRAMFTWHGFAPWFDGWNNIGGPALEDDPFYLPEGDSIGRLTAPYFIGRATLHADKSWDDESDDPEQPSTMSYIRTGHEITGANDPYDKPAMQNEYTFITEGRVEPTHAEQVVGEGTFATQTNDPSQGTAGGFAFNEGFGPYELPPGESLRFVIIEGVSGLSDEAAVHIGRAYKHNFLAGNGDALIEFDANGNGQIDADEEMTKNEWVMTSRDSLFKMFQRARANYSAGGSIPEPPLPPREFRVQSSNDKIILAWDTYDGASPQGYEVWRAASRVDSTYRLVAELPASADTFEDSDVVRGISYYYYIQSIGEVNDDPTGMTPTGVPLKSNRYYTQTYAPAILKRAPGEELDEARVVPNPYDLGSSQDLRWPGERDRIGFLDIPGDATIRIYTELGELIETIDHTDGSGDAYWDLTTTSNQVVVSGVYIALIEDKASGETVIRKFTIIR